MKGKTMRQNKPNGCDLCGDWPIVLSSKCHPTAPLRLEMKDEKTLVAYCYLPDCNRKVARFAIEKIES